ncbi:MAG: hypothetical protein AAF581_08445 [Planctomycetota bacterium]
MTLIELLVATGIFLFLGSALIMFLNVGINMWRVGEIRREAYERAQAIVDTIASDLTSTFPDPSQGTKGQVDVVLLSDHDANGRQRLRFVRTLAGEMRHPVTQHAGSLTGAYFDYDYDADAEQLEMGMLRAPGGLQEIAYIMDPRPELDLLYRAARSPIGGPSTLFDNDKLYRWDDLDAAPLGPGSLLRPLADGVLHLEFRFWGQDTETWMPLEEQPDVTPAERDWDSTGGILGPMDGDVRGDFDDSSRHEHRDDVFPSRVQIVLVLRPARAARFAKLSARLSSHDDEVRVDRTTHYPDGAFQYIKIDDEWIRYGGLSKNGFLEVERGVRGTEAADHERGATVVYGTTFTRIVRIPGARRSRWGG